MKGERKMEILFNLATGRFEVWADGAGAADFEAEDFGRCITYRKAMREAGLC